MIATAVAMTFAADARVDTIATRAKVVTGRVHARTIVAIPGIAFPTLVNREQFRRHVTKMEERVATIPIAATIVVVVDYVIPVVVPSIMCAVFKKIIVSTTRIVAVTWFVVVNAVVVQAAVGPSVPTFGHCK